MRHRGPVAPRMTIHPLTGQIIRPVGVVGGKTIYPIMGGAPDDDDDDDDKDKDKDKDDDAGDSGSSDKKDADKDDGDSGSDDDDRWERLEKRMRAADRRADEAERKLKDRERAEQDDVTRAKSELEDAQSENEKLKETVSRLRLENAFLTANNHKWHDPDTALDIAQSKGYLEDVVNEEGEVDKKLLKKALDRLATEKKFLVAADKVDDKDKGDQDPPSGEPAGGRSDNTKDDKSRKEQLRRRFPALNR